MFTLTKEFRFEAAHRLPHHDGKCARLHGHSWKMRVVLQGGVLHQHNSKAGMLTDFGDISSKVKPLVEDCLDHHHLNDTTGLQNPTSEELARWIFNQLEKKLEYRAGFVHVFLKAIEVDETCTSSCRYEPDQE